MDKGMKSSSNVLCPLCKQQILHEENDLVCVYDKISVLGFGSIFTTQASFDEKLVQSRCLFHKKCFFLVAGKEFFKQFKNEVTK